MFSARPSARSTSIGRAPGHGCALLQQLCKSTCGICVCLCGAECHVASPFLTSCSLCAGEAVVARACDG